MSLTVPLEGFGGGGTSLNFAVKAYASEDLLPATAKENTIAVITDTPINGYSFSATEPAEPMEGMVWFTTGVSSPVEFNALKKYTLMVYPLSAMQYVDGAWVIVTAMSYQDGEWADWVRYLYAYGKEYVEMTTWQGTCTEQDAYVLLQCAQNGVARYATQEKQNISEYSKIKLTFSANNTDVGEIKIKITSDPNTDVASASSVDKSGVVVLDVSEISGSYYVVAQLYCANAATARVESIEMCR